MVLESLDKIEKAAGDSRQEIFRLGTALLFLIATIEVLSPTGVQFGLLRCTMVWPPSTLFKG